MGNLPLAAFPAPKPTAEIRAFTLNHTSAGPVARPAAQRGVTLDFHYGTWADDTAGGSTLAVNQVTGVKVTCPSALLKDQLLPKLPRKLAQHYTVGMPQAVGYRWRGLFAALAKAVEWLAMDTKETSLLPRAAGNRTLAVAVGSVALLFVGLSVLNPRPIADEAGHHLPVIRQFYNGDWSWPDHLPMLPTYHVIATGVAKVCGANLLVLRAFSLVMAIVAIIIFRGVTRHRALGEPDDALLHFAWHPILFPFTVMVYTDIAAMLCLVGAVYLHVRRRLVVSALLLLLACLVRQSNVVWVVFMAVWAVSERDDRDRGGAKAVLPQLWPHLALVGGGAVYFILMGGTSPAPVEANRIRINVAQFYLFALFVIVLWAPVWLARLPDDWRAFYRWGVGHPGAGVTAVLVGLAFVVVLTIGFRNPHPWNHNPDYLRNWPLMLLSDSWTARIAAGILIVGLAPSVVRFTIDQPHRRMLGLTWFLSLLFLLPHSLAEPRYYIVPVFLLNFFTSYTASAARHITLWYLFLSAGVGLAVCLGGHPGGGVW